MSFLTSIIYPLSFLFVLSIVVVIHELGHFLVARACGVRVDAFSFGFGKTLWERTDKRGTVWKICLLPLGGYVKMFGDADASSATADAEKVKEMTEEDKKVAFLFQSVWKKLAIIIAGPGMNYVSAILMMTVLLSVYGLFVVPPVVHEVMKDSVAEKAGIMANDRFLTINGAEIKEFADIRRATQLNSDLHIVLERDGQKIEKDVSLERKDGVAMLGVSAVLAQADFKHVGIGEAFVLSLKEAWTMTEDTVIVLKQIVTGRRSAEDMRGPLGIAEASGDAFRSGLEIFLMFIVQVSIGIGFVNLLPVPVLDGGQIVLFSIEGITGRPLSEKMQTVALALGLTFLLGLLILTSWNDVTRIFQRLFG